MDDLYRKNHSIHIYNDKITQKKKKKTLRKINSCYLSINKIKLYDKYI